MNISFERLREVLIEELEDKTCEPVKLPFEEEFLDRLLFDGATNFKNFAKVLKPILTKIDFSNVSFKGYEAYDKDFSPYTGIKINDLVKNPILIKNSSNYTNISEKILKQLILEDLSNFMRELGEGFCFIDKEYKIKIGKSYNYIDLLLYNIKYNCYVVIELKVTELKKDHIGQIETYMNYIDNNIKTIYQDNTIGIIICKKDNFFIMEYCSNPKIFETTYKIEI